MKIKRGFKKDTKFIMIVAILLTLVTLRVSYSAVFSVKNTSTIQKINTGTLSIVLDNSTSAYQDLTPTATNLLPTATNSVTTGTYSSLSFTNNGTLASEYEFTIERDMEAIPPNTNSSELLAFNYLNVGVYDTAANQWVNLGSSESPEYYKSLSSLPSGKDKGNYAGGYTKKNDESKILTTGTISIGATKQYRVYVWLSETTPSEEINKKINLKLNVSYATIKDETLDTFYQ